MLRSLWKWPGLASTCCLSPCCSLRAKRGGGEAAAQSQRVFKMEKATKLPVGARVDVAVRDVSAHLSTPCFTGDMGTHCQAGSFGSSNSLDCEVLGVSCARLDWAKRVSAWGFLGYQIPLALHLTAGCCLVSVSWPHRFFGHTRNGLGRMRPGG